MTLAYIALGANLGEPLITLRAAIKALDLEEGCGRVSAVSSFYRSAPLAKQRQPDYLNAVCALNTALSPHSLLAKLLAIETRFGRVRGKKNAPRTLDLDLLLYGDYQCAEPDLTLPHPRLHERAFVLLPLIEIAPQLVIPRRGRLADLLPTCAHQRCEKISIGLLAEGQNLF